MPPTPTRAKAQADDKAEDQADDVTPTRTTTTGPEQGHVVQLAEADDQAGTPARYGICLATEDTDAGPVCHVADLTHLPTVAVFARDLS